MTLSVAETVLILVLLTGAGTGLITWREYSCEVRMTKLREDFAREIALMRDLFQGENDRLSDLLDKTRSQAASALQAVANIVWVLKQGGRYNPSDLDEISTIVLAAGKDITLGGDVAARDKKVGSTG
jgi:hypothetical protein